MKSVLVIIDTIEAKLPASAFELIGFAETFAGGDTASVRVVIAGNTVGDVARQAARYGYPVIGIESDELRYPHPDLLAICIKNLVQAYPPHCICLLHTPRACQVAAQVALDAKMACITGVESYRFDEKRRVFRRSLFNGKIALEVAPDIDSSIVTVLPGAYHPPDITAKPRASGTVEIRKETSISRYKPLQIRRSVEEDVKLEESDVIVSAGRGIGTEENLDLIRAVARLFPNAAIGASRPICDLKWLSFAHQVGVTGKSVSPKLYLACGISGAQQHIAGMKGSRTVVSINKDPHAAIFSVSDFIVVEDLTTFLPLLIRKYQQMLT